jgi:hypothetical protein
MSRQSSQTRVRCAIYTRLSRETNQEFSSCEAQFDACRAFIRARRGDGWTSTRRRYDDQGLSGDTLLAGVGIAGGQVYGKSDKHGANPIRPEELAATVYHALDIPLDAPQNNSGLSLPLTTGKPVMELFG